MKYIKMILLVLPMLGLISCVKQKNCEEGITGAFVYLEKSYYIENACEKKTKVVAHFFPNINPKNAKLQDGYITEVVREITGTVPKKFQTNDTINVVVNLESCNKNDYTEYYNTHSITYTLKCIEKVD